VWRAGRGGLVVCDAKEMGLTKGAYSASAPEMISISSLVIIAWRERL
jgi:hypothetical protein